MLCHGFKLFSWGKVIVDLHAERTVIFTPDKMMLGEKYYCFLLILLNNMMMSAVEVGTTPATSTCNLRPVETAAQV